MATENHILGLSYLHQVEKFHTVNNIDHVTMKRVLAGAAVRLFFYLSQGRQLLAQSHLCDTWSAPTATTDSALFCRVTPLAFATLCHLQLMPTLSAPCRWPSSHSRWLPLLSLLLCGDVQCNPGPRRLKYPCGSCQRAVMSNQPGVQCEVCYLWYHCRCLGLTSTDYSECTLLHQHQHTFDVLTSSLGIF